MYLIESLLRLERGVDADAEPGGGARDELAESGRIVADGRGGGGGAGVGALLLALGWRRRDTLRRIEHQYLQQFKHIQGFRVK